MAGTREAISQFYLKIGGAPAPEAMMDDVISVEVDDSLTLPDMFLINLRDPTLCWTNSQALELGKQVEVSVRAQQGAVKLMEGEITAVELDAGRHLPTLLVRGYDLSHRLHRDRKTRTYQNHTDSDIAAKIAREGGLGVQSDSTGKVYEHITQRNQTDWEFLWERARRIGFRVYVKGKTLHFRRPPKVGGVPKLEWGVDLLEFRTNLTTAEQVKEVTVRGWDPVRKKEVLGRATRPRVDLDIGEKRLGGDATDRAFRQQPKMVVVDHPVTSAGEADALAQGIYDDIGGAFIEAEGVSSGNPGVAAGMAVDLSGLGRRFDGRYMVTRSQHHWTLQGYSTRFMISGHRTTTLADLLRPPDNSAGHSVFVAKVTNNKDPENLGRVKLQYPWLSDKDESGWARLALPGASKRGGLVWVPDVGDEVLVAFGHGNINYPYVLGGLWSKPDPFPYQISDIVDGQGKVTAHAIVVGDFTIKISDKPGEEHIRIADSRSGQVICLDRTKKKIEITSDQGDIAIKGKNVNIEASGVVTIKGQQQIKLN